MIDSRGVHFAPRNSADAQRTVTKRNKRKSFCFHSISVPRPSSSCEFFFSFLVFRQVEQERPRKKINWLGSEWGIFSFNYKIYWHVIYVSQTVDLLPISERESTALNLNIGSVYRGPIAVLGHHARVDCFEELSTRHRAGAKRRNKCGSERGRERGATLRK